MSSKLTGLVSVASNPKLLDSAAGSCHGYPVSWSDNGILHGYLLCSTSQQQSACCAYRWTMAHRALVQSLQHVQDKENVNAHSHSMNKGSHHRTASVKAPAMRSFKTVQGTRLKGVASELQTLQQQSHNVQLHDTNITDQLVAQVGLLQNAFAALADGVLVELDTLQRNAACWQSDRQEWLTNMRSIRQDVNDKLLQVDKLQMKAVLEINKAQTNAQAEVSQACQRLEQRAVELEGQITTARIDMQVLRNAVQDMQLLTSKDFPSQLIQQRLQHTQEVELAIKESIQTLVPAAVSAAVEKHTTQAVQTQMAGLIRQEVRTHAEVLRQEVTCMTDQAGSDLGSLTVEMATLAGAVESLSARTQALEASNIAIESKVRSLETQASTSSMHTSLQERVDSITSQQARFAHSMEQVVQALVEDAAQQACTAHHHERTLRAHALHVRQTRQDLAQCAATFASLLNVPPPIPIDVSSPSTSTAGHAAGAIATQATFLGCDLSELEPLSPFSPDTLVAQQ